MTIEFKNGETLEALGFMEMYQRVMGADRNSLVITFDSDATSADEVLKLSEEGANTEQLTITDGEKKVIYKDFSILHKIEINSEEINVDETTVKTIYQMKVVLLEKTYAEKQLDLIAKQIIELNTGMDTLNEVTADIIGGVY